MGGSLWAWWSYSFTLGQILFFGSALAYFLASPMLAKYLRARLPVSLHLYQKAFCPARMAVRTTRSPSSVNKLGRKHNRLSNCRNWVRKVHGTLLFLQMLYGCWFKIFMWAKAFPAHNQMSRKNLLCSRMWLDHSCTLKSFRATQLPNIGSLSQAGSWCLSMMDVHPLPASTLACLCEPEGGPIYWWTRQRRLVAPSSVRRWDLVLMVWMMKVLGAGCAVHLTVGCVVEWHAANAVGHWSNARAENGIWALCCFGQVTEDSEQRVCPRPTP